MSRAHEVVLMQFSDLHMPNTKIDSNALVSSIVSDLKRHDKEDPRIKKSDILVVCGDLIKGVNYHDDLLFATKELDEQYNKSCAFLNNLCRSVFNGDNEKVIIVPGNHDVSWHHSKSCMEKIDDKNLDLYKLSKNPLSNIRWDWNDHSYYKIVNFDLYSKRFLPFSKFYSKFYNGKRKYSLTANHQYDIFEYPEYELLIVGFNSCYRNDHLNITSRINPNSMSNCHAQINNDEYEKWIKIAVWHHSLHGFPQRIDFLDEGTIQFLIDKGFNIGLHGHLHKGDIFKIMLSADQRVQMQVFGSGSLSASQSDIPAGEKRQYSIIEFSNNLILYHIRNAVELPIGLPIWMKGTLEQNMNKSYMKITIGREVIEVSPSSEMIKELSVIDELITQNAYSEALKKLEYLDQKDPFVRKLTTECLFQLELDDRLISFIGNPKTTSEFIYFSESLWRQEKIPELKQLLIKVKKNKDIVGSEAFKRMKLKIEYGGK